MRANKNCHYNILITTIIFLKWLLYIQYIYRYIKIMIIGILLYYS